ncbi:TetR/AcrR family transcriptional regulator [Shewanella corallii]|uniref:TetR/AcrR family transcriptional regulator n=1 Tax=Shewanella corallii TaxID=560080 RepID=A0ABT0NE10_9GAMM|nr:TetR/AcrR family transcriptional regulator [Shewanella corallii]MCL2916360.1 TetR/AcrR family transcriptional regulator [Shewanella corallii]
MGCQKSEQDREICNGIMREAEKLILEHGVLSFPYTSIIKKNLCSARVFYKHFSSREDILVCTLMRRSITWDVEHFLAKNPDLSKKVQVFIPTLISLEISRVDPVYVSACLIANNSSVWQLASEEKMRLLRMLDERYYKCIRDATRQAVDAGILEVTQEECDALTDDLYYYCLGKLASVPLIITNYRPLACLKKNEVQSLISLTSHHNWKEAVTKEELEDAYKRVVDYFHDARDGIDCERCIYIRETQEKVTH